MNRPDTNVRAGAPVHARLPRWAPRGALGRLLVPTAVMVTLPACVIPLAPDFQDPPAAENSPPRIVSSNPEQGSLVASMNLFQVTVTDPNPGDTLSIRWYADFPPLQANTRPIPTDVGRIPPSADGTVQTTLLSATVDCQGDSLAPGITQHTITVVISDTDFGPAGATTSFKGDHEATATWSLLLQCFPP